MIVERLGSPSCSAPFPVYDRLIEEMLAAPHQQRDATLAHVLAVCAGYSYSDPATVAMMMSRIGFEASACVRIAQTVDAMYIFSTAYLLQSKCGRVVILSYRGTEPGNFGSWIADADMGSASMKLGDEKLRVHRGFYRNVRATRIQVVEELTKAARGQSLLDGRQLDHPMQALYVTGHSLGGAMAVLFALSLASDDLADRLRAVYTFGQPLTVGEPLPEGARGIAAKVFRHVNARDVIPALPARAWGRLTHFGNEYRCVDGQWTRAEEPIAQLSSMRGIPRSLFAMLDTATRKKPSRYTMADPPPHEYIAALRPPGRISELGDYD